MIRIVRGYICPEICAHLQKARLKQVNIETFPHETTITEYNLPNENGVVPL